jgi:hypothetical protein
MVVTSEPYFSVTQPSDVVVMQNVLRPETRGQVEQIQAKFELLQRGQYSLNVPPGELKPISLDPKTPLEIYEARNAVRIARWADADKDAADSFAKADQSLNQAENYLVRKQTKPSITAARQAVQTAEDSRLIALKRQDEARLEREPKPVRPRQVYITGNTVTRFFRLHLPQPRLYFLHSDLFPFLTMLLILTTLTRKHVVLRRQHEIWKQKEMAGIRRLRRFVSAGVGSKS